VAWENKIPNFNFPSPEIKALRVGKGIFLSYLGCESKFSRLNFLKNKELKI